MYKKIFNTFIDYERKKIYNEYFDEYIKLNPSINNYLRLKEYPELNMYYDNDISKEYKIKMKGICYKYHKKLKNLKYKNIFDKILNYKLKNELEYYKYNLDFFPITHYDNFILDFVEECSGNGVLILENKRDYELFLKRYLPGFSKYYENIIKKLRVGMDKNIILPKIIVEQILKQFDDILDNTRYINDKINNEEYKDIFNRTIRDFIIPKIFNIKNFFEKEYRTRESIGLCSLKNGKNIYKYLCKEYTTLKNIDILKIHILGMKEIKRILEEMVEVKRESNFEGNLHEFYDDIKNNSNNYFIDSNEIMDEFNYEAEYYMKEKFNNYFYEDNNFEYCDIFRSS